MTLIFIVFLALPLYAGARRQKPAAAGGESAAPADPTAEYYAGRIENAAALLEEKIGALEKAAKSRKAESDSAELAAARRSLAVLYREMGEADRALRLDEELGAGAEALFEASLLAGAFHKAAAFAEDAADRAWFGSAKEQADHFFYKGLWEQERGADEKAEELFRKSLELYRWRPIAWYRLGTLLEARAGDADTRLAKEAARREARSAYRTAIAQDGALAEARARLAEIAEAAAPEPSAEALIKRKIAANPPQVKVPPDVPAYASYPGGGLIRVGLAERRPLVSIKAGGAFTIAAEGAGVVYRGKAREQLVFAAQKAGGISVENMSGGVIAKTQKPLTLELADGADTFTIAGIVSGQPGAKRNYRGKIELRPGAFDSISNSVDETAAAFTVVNILPIEEYLYSVVPSELPASWPEEALKAQAVAARAYALANIGQFAERGFDLYGTPHSMAYLGESGEHKNGTAAVDATRGLILAAGGAPLKAYFSANHGGYSEDSRTMWGYDAYMAAVPDPGLPARASPLSPAELDLWLRATPSTYSSVPQFYFPASYRWEKWVRPAEIARRLKAGGRGDVGEIKRIVTRGRGISGRVVKVEVAGSEGSIFVSGDAIWNSMGALRSSLFTIDYQFDKFGKLEYIVFRGAGHGHGIGMDQHGAAGMASLGFKAEDILKLYYPLAGLLQL